MLHSIKKLPSLFLIPNEHVLLWWPNGHGDQPLYELVVSSNNQEIGFATYWISYS